MTFGEQATLDAQLKLAVALLRENGFTVLNLPKMMPLVEYRKELKLRSNQISPLLRHPACPKFNAIRGARNRIYTIEPTPELSTFLLCYSAKSQKKS